jgi:hypothetical protein
MPGRTQSLLKRFPEQPAPAPQCSPSHSPQQRILSNFATPEVPTRPDAFDANVSAVKRGSPSHLKFRKWLTVEPTALRGERSIAYPRAPDGTGDAIAELIRLCRKLVRYGETLGYFPGAGERKEAPKVKLKDLGTKVAKAAKEALSSANTLVRVAEKELSRLYPSRQAPGTKGADK